VALDLGDADAVVGTLCEQAAHQVPPLRRDAPRDGVFAVQYRLRRVSDKSQRQLHSMQNHFATFTCETLQNMQLLKKHPEHDGFWQSQSAAPVQIRLAVLRMQLLHGGRMTRKARLAAVRP